MAEIVNLRQVRRQKARAEAGKVADQNRALTGRTKAEKQSDRLGKDAARSFLDGHRRDRRPNDK